MNSKPDISFCEIELITCILEMSSYHKNELLAKKGYNSVRQEFLSIMCKTYSGLSDVKNK